jgi:hypothetical protein
MHTFVVSDESIINEYGYRVMTDGINITQYERNPLVLFLHTRGKAKDVVGKAMKLYKENGKLMADIEFDMEDEDAADLAGKVERGFIRMASIFATPEATSNAEEDILPGQLFETVTKCKLREISIVDLGGNDNALKLSAASPLKLNLQPLNTENPETMNIKQIALALGLDAETKPEVVLQKVSEIKLSAENADTEKEALRSQLKAIRDAEANQLVTKAVELKLIPEGLKESQLKALETDFDNQKVLLSGLITEAEKTFKKDHTQTAIGKIVGGGQGAEGGVELSFDYLQQNDPEKLRELKDNNNAEYVRLAQEYAKGKRWTPAKN